MKYYVCFAMDSAEPFNYASPFKYNDASLEHKMQECYRDSFEIGEFNNDKDAYEKVMEIQNSHDNLAIKILNESLPNAVLEGGPCYANCVYKEVEESNLEKVEF